MGSNPIHRNSARLRRALACAAIACAAVDVASAQVMIAAALGRCESLAARRDEASRAGDLVQLNRAATEYVESCRAVHSRTEVSAAMAELAAIRRMAGQADEALAAAQECIRFEYLALDCHVEKAKSLQIMGMRTEARQVIATARDIAERLKVLGRHELAKVEAGRSKIKPEQAAAMTREAKARLKMAESGDSTIAAAENSMGAK